MSAPQHVCKGQRTNFCSYLGSFIMVLVVTLSFLGARRVHLYKGILMTLYIILNVLLGARNLSQLSE